MNTFNPKPCPCGCRKWIMAPWFTCQCSSVSTAEKNELVAMARDAARYRWLRSRSIGIRPYSTASPLESKSLDDVCDGMLDEKRHGTKTGEDVDPFLGRNHAS